MIFTSLTDILLIEPLCNLLGDFEMFKQDHKTFLQRLPCNGPQV